jgi:DNA-binding MarR family transcriptional regulator
MKTPKQLERYFKGAANHRRLEILFLIRRKNDLTLDKISKILGCNIKTISGHTSRLLQAGLLNKKYRGREVVHSLSPYGQLFVDFAKSF